VSEPARDRRAPCLIGVGRRTWHPADVGPDGAPEPIEMWEEVARAAAADASAPGCLRSLESLQVVYCQAWEYDDPPGRLAGRLGADPTHTAYSGIGGSVPQMLVASAAEAIGGGHLDLALVVGAEALATRRRAKKEGRRLAWSHAPEQRSPFPFDVPVHPGEAAHQIHQAYLTFAMFDNARRAHRGTGLAEHRDQLGRLLSPMTGRAAAQPEHAWFPVARTPGEITTPTAENRMVAYPYTKLMTAILDVDMAAGLLLASDARADDLGVPLEHRVYLRGWGYAEDPPHVAARRDLWRSGSMEVVGAAATRAAGVGPDDLAHLDLYTCFASSPCFALDALGVDVEAACAPGPTPPDRPVTVTGGLPYHGGPGSNYMTHGIAALAETLRADPGSYGMVTGVGMHMMRHVAAVWSTVPGRLEPPDPAALARAVVERQPLLPVVARGEGAATVATYSVLHGRDGAPEWAALVCDLPDGTRCYARMEDPEALAAAEVDELIGQPVLLATTDGGVNWAVT